MQTGALVQTKLLLVPNIPTYLALLEPELSPQTQKNELKRMEAMQCYGALQVCTPVMRIRTSHGFAGQADSRQADSDSQAFLILCHSPCHRRFLLGDGVGTVRL